MNDNNLKALVAVVLAVLLGCVFYFGVVYNNNQNVSRDEFYAQHCKTVATSSNVNGGTQYQCGKQ